MSRLSSFLAELQRRRVYRVAVMYAAAAFVAAQAADLFLPRLGLPDWTVTAAVVLVVAGFPVALLLGWLFDVTPSGVRLTEAAPQEAPTNRPNTWRWLGGSAAGLAILVATGWWLTTLAFRSSPTVERLAVLPLVNLMNDSQQDYFVQGMHDALISELSQAGIAVIARTSVMRYQGTRKSVRDIADELKVEAVIEGSVFRAGDSVRIQVQLIDGQTEAHFWAQTYEGDLRDVLGLHRRVTSAVAREIRMGLSQRVRAQLAAKHTIDREAYEAYLKGISYLERGTPAARKAALNWFNAAVEKDPNYALAYLGIRQAWAGLRQAGLASPSEATPKMRAALARALELDPTLPEIHYALATEATWTDWNWAVAEIHFRRAIQLNPHYARARAFYSHYLHIMGRPDEAMVEIQRATELDPFNPLIRAIAGGAFLMDRRYDKALVHFRATLELAPGSLNGLTGVSNALHYAGRYDAALTAERERARAEYGDPDLDAALARGYAERGYRGAMRRAADLLSERALTRNVAPGSVARLYLRAGENERALEWLERSYQERDPNLPYISSGHKDFDALRSHPRFRALLGKMNLPK